MSDINLLPTGLIPERDFFRRLEWIKRDVTLSAILVDSTFYDCQQKENKEIIKLSLI